MAEIHVLVVPQTDPYGEDLGGASGAIENFGDRAGEVSNCVATVGRSLQQNLEGQLNGHEAGWSVKEVQFEFGLDIEAESGILIAKAKVGTTFKVLLTLSRP